ncbi:MAG: ABC transporter ATP-binding protein [Planctomycetaceae bacterium]|nr:ABC transporter ATP-binding protein [Planctomycetaceae bacterium]
MIDIILEGISKQYASAVWALRDVSVHVQPGELFFLLGPSGCGKTTLLRIIAGLLAPTGGRVRLGERDVTHLSIERRNTAMVFQNYALWPHMSVQQNVEFGPRMRGLAADKRRGVALESLQRVEMESYAARKPNQLSGGQQQRVAVARALAAQASCLLLDEPLSNLDARLRAHMRGELRSLVKSTGATAVYVTHDQKEALSMADRVAVMNAGRVVQIDTPEALYHRPATRFVAEFLGEANFVAGTVGGGSGGGAEVRTALGVLAAAAREGVGPGAPVTCCVRPEHVAIQPSGAGLEATIESSTFLGEVRQYRCRMSDGSAWRVTALAAAADGLAVGDRVRLHVAAQNVALLTE